VCLLAVCSSVAGTIINVPGDQPTIQAAIDASADTDTVLVAPGTYYENIGYHGKDIVVSSHFLFDQDPKYILSTVINGSAPSHADTASCVRIVDGQGPSTVLQGFTLTEGTGTVWTDPQGHGVYREGGGVLTEGSTPIIQYNLIIDNVAIDRTDLTSAGGGGIRSGAGQVSILNNVIMDNQGRYGGGIVLNYTPAIIRNNVIARNTGGEDFGGAGIWKYGGASATVENNTIVGNISASYGGGVYCGGSTIMARNNLIRSNAAPSGAQISGEVYATYCNVQSGWSGSGNIDGYVAFCEPFYFPLAGSPGIDGGDPDPAFNDPEDPNAPGWARWPAHETLRNCMGAYGGPRSFPFHLAAMANDPAFGWAPLEVNFVGYTGLLASGWSGDFGDEGQAAGQSVSHTYNLGGLYDVTLTVATDTDPYTLIEHGLITVLADTMTASNEVYQPGSPVAVTVDLRNNAPVTNMSIPIEYDGAVPLTLDSMSVVGCRTDYFEEVSIISLNPSGHQATVFLQCSAAGTQPELAPGSGPVVKAWFQVTGPVAFGEVTDIVMDGYSAYTPLCAGSITTYAPLTVAGTITGGGCCRDRVGDANGLGDDEPTIGDVSVLIDAKFITGTCDGILDCFAEADVNQSGGPDPNCDDITIGDISTLIDYLFITGSSLGLAECL
jgi:PKD repeat protein